MATYGKRTALYCLKCGKKIFTPRNAVIGSARCVACNSKFVTFKEYKKVPSIRKMVYKK